MQISAANLLLAAQQPKPASSAPAEQTSFTHAMTGAKAPAVRLDLPSFDDEPAAPTQAPAQAAAPAPAQAAAPYGGASTLGAQLDIRV